MRWIDETFLFLLIHLFYSNKLIKNIPFYYEFPYMEALSMLKTSREPPICYNLWSCESLYNIYSLVNIIFRVEAEI